MSRSASGVSTARGRRTKESRSAEGGLLKVTLRRSLIGHPKDQKETARALGLTKMNSTVVRADTPAVRGMVTKIIHLVRVENAGAMDEGQ
jgi:large subunit ribosomal protein L30